MEIKNSYPQLPVIEAKKTSVSMIDVIVFAKSLLQKYDPKFIRMAYAIFRNESSNGLSGVNNNYAGIQADVGMWSNLPGTPIGTCVQIDSGKQQRRFLCFNDSDGYKISFELICIKSKERNMILPKDYFTEWVGRPNYTLNDLSLIQSMLIQAKLRIG